MTQIKVHKNLGEAAYLTDQQVALLIEVLATRHSELISDQEDGNTEQWLGDMIDELEELNYIIPFLPEGDATDPDTQEWPTPDDLANPATRAGRRSATGFNDAGYYDGSYDDMGA